jgi:hypothetical protein
LLDCQSVAEQAALVAWQFLSTSQAKGTPMKTVMTALVSALMLLSAPSFAGSHGGGKMDDKKVDCSKKENEKNPACASKK